MVEKSISYFFPDITVTVVACHDKNTTEKKKNNTRTLSASMANMCSYTTKYVFPFKKN